MEIEQVRVKKTEIPCLLCGETEYQVKYQDELGDRPAQVDYDFTPDTQKTYQIVNCPNCRLIYTNPMPDLSQVYTDTEDESYLESTDQRKQTARGNLRRILKFKSSGKLLDIGSNTGIFLDAASQYFDVEGIELSQWGRKLTPKNIQVFDKTLGELDFQELYDVITLFGVIEHFSDPVKELKAVWKALKPDGIVVIYTGDVEGFLPRLMGKNWWYFMGMHLVYFSKKTLIKMLQRCGFQVMSEGLHTMYFQLFSLSKSFDRYPIARPISFLLGLPLIKNIMIPLKLSGEMILIAKKVDE